MPAPLLLGPAVLAAAAVVAVCAGSRVRLAAGALVLGTAVSSALALTAAIPVLLGGEAVTTVLHAASPFGPLRFGMDAVSAVFVALVATLAVPAAVYGTSYLADRPERRRTSVAHGLLALLVASITVVFIARNAGVFLVAWEAMTVSSYFLIAFDHERADVRRAGMRYLVASQLAAACILAFLGTLAARGGSLDFEDLARAGRAAPPLASWTLFALALVGFGTKSGLVPFHVWLPRAHPVAPSHVSAVMSGAVIKVGIYGLVRATLLLGGPSEGFGMVLVGIGAVSAVVGIANALIRRDLKRSLAYSSVENVGIATVGLGIAIAGAALGLPEVAAFAGAGAFLHLVHHMLMKGLLFLGSGSVLHATGERDLERLGGLLRRMPWTGGTFLAGAAAISALPPFCGFLGEWLILVGAFRAVSSFPVGDAAVVVAAILALLLAGGLTAATFARNVSAAFLGEPRTPAAAHAHEAGWAMRGPMVFLAALCLVPGLAPHAAVGVVTPAVQVLAGGRAATLTADSPLLATARDVGVVAWILLGAIVVVAAARRLRSSATAAERVGTWGCGYSLPGTRMQYTATSFAAPLTAIVSPVTGAVSAPGARLPTFAGTIERPPEPGDAVEERFYERVFGAIALRCGAIRSKQDGRIGRYILRILAVLVACVVWAVTSRWALE